jgi:ABC-type Fe3+/spermidine/putrescine transport system ATPase subunit
LQRGGNKLALISLENITKRFDKIVAVNQLALTVDDGEYICILGPTGAGKTTLLRIIAGLVKPDTGTITINDEIVNFKPPEERDTLYMFQQYALFPHMNVWDNVSYGPTIKNWPEERIDQLTREILEMVHLAERADAFPNDLSGGMQQRVALGRGIASGARILLLDEPLGALDARLRVDLRTQLRKLVKDQALTAIHVTHDQEEALMIGDRIVVLRNGQIEQIGSPQEIYEQPHSIFVASFVGGANFIEGNVISCDEMYSTIELRGRLQIRAQNTQFTTGDRIVVAFRLEDTKIMEEKGEGENNLHGTIETAMFIGGFMEYQVLLDNKVRVLAKVLVFEGFESFQPNDSVYISIPVNDCFVFPYPEQGLLKEIEAI